MFPSLQPRLTDEVRMQELKEEAIARGFIETDVRNTVVVDTPEKLEFA
jgi:hypothetical protein